MTKWYVEMSATGTSNFKQDQCAGVAESTATLTSIFNSWPTNNNPNHGCAIHFGNGTTSSDWGNPIFLNGTQQAKSGDIFGILTAFGMVYDDAADATWFKCLSGSNIDTINWNYDALANPSTGAHGISVSALAKPLFPFCQASNNTGLVVTANFGASAFIQAVPGGCTPGWRNNGTRTTWNSADLQAGILSGGSLVFTSAIVGGLPSTVRASGGARPIISTVT